MTLLTVSPIYVHPTLYEQLQNERSQTRLLLNELLAATKTLIGLYRWQRLCYEVRQGLAQAGPCFRANVKQMENPGPL